MAANPLRKQPLVNCGSEGAGSKQKCTQKQPSSQPLAVLADSTTRERETADFAVGVDVLLKQKDGRYYLGTVVEVDTVREQCLVKFGDNTESWSQFKGLNRLNAPEQDDALCVICKTSIAIYKQPIIVCDKCGRGYHPKCHEPEIPSVYHKGGGDGGVAWICKRCKTKGSYLLRRSTGNSILPKPKTDDPSSPNYSHNRSLGPLPYDIKSLQWDTYHRYNAEQRYCYCGENGDWCKQMLQCTRCKQWFHEKCLTCLQFPLYCGDRFYIFVCSICNQGHEFCRRLEMKWVDLVHLVLFNLTVYNSGKYFHLDDLMIPYINDNWETLNLPQKMYNVPKDERRLNIINVLSNNRNRFKCGKEIKKRTTIWGLRIRLPPPVPTISLSMMGVVNEQALREVWQGNRRLHFLPLVVQPQGKFVSRPPIPHTTTSSELRNIMMGLAYQQTGPYSDSDSSCPSPESEMKTVSIDDAAYRQEFSELSNMKTEPTKFRHNNSHQRNNKQRPHSDSESNNSSENVKRRRRKSDRTNDRTAVPSGGGYTTRLSLDRSCKPYDTALLPEGLPLSGSAPTTPPASGSTSILSDLSNDFSEPYNKASNKSSSSSSKKCNGFDVELNTPCDTSGDETSSKSTLDLIIPPPKDFEGKNNPFLALLKANTTEDTTKGKTNKKSSTALPLPLSSVIPNKPFIRTKKRQLSEKDILIGPNGEVKRRKCRRNRLLAQLNTYSTGPTATKTATFVPIRSNTKDWKESVVTAKSGAAQIGDCVDYVLNGRRLRQRSDKASAKSELQLPLSSGKSPVKQESNINMNELKSSVNMYFGAVNRIATGERFSIKAKRTSPKGKVEFLIEWDGPGNNIP